MCCNWLRIDILQKVVKKNKNKKEAITRMYILDKLYVSTTCFCTYVDKIIF